MIQGVELKLSDLERLRPTLFEPPKKSRAGRKHDVSARDRGWLTIVQLSQEGELNSNVYDAISSLKEEMILRLATNKKRSNGDDILALGVGQIDEIAGMVQPLLKPRTPA